MTDHELVEETVNIIHAAYNDESIDFSGFGSQCDWIGYQVRKLFTENRRMPEKSGQLKLNLDPEENRKHFAKECIRKGQHRVTAHRYCFG